MAYGRSSLSISLSKLAFIVVLLLLFGETFVKGQPQVIGSTQPIVASLGEDAILLCQVEPPADVTGLTVEWSKPDLRYDPNKQGWVEYVHLYRDYREVPDMKLSSYVRRTKLFTNELRQGNISLKISNVTPEDEGSYRCYIPKLRSRARSAVVHLVVGSHSSKTTETPPQLTSLPSPNLRGGTNITGGLPRSRLALIGVLIVFLMVMSLGVICFLLQKCEEEKLIKVLII
ncbi:uncharacterized protein LOC117807508 [Xyrichtys novacula]|uniref:Uncharacterized protein LOC117807508 n=1 Tax=Xyrichtys novacula TaxID=13765 RepID=A0AAV1HKU3_XYRNO|nr:uncharacterized protein LOC117807508 [Xyrichtys novacula]